GAVPPAAALIGAGGENKSMACSLKPGRCGSVVQREGAAAVSPELAVPAGAAGAEDERQRSPTATAAPTTASKRSALLPCMGLTGRRAYCVSAVPCHRRAMIVRSRCYPMRTCPTGPALRLAHANPGDRVRGDLRRVLAVDRLRQGDEANIERQVGHVDRVARAHEARREQQPARAAARIDA